MPTTPNMGLNKPVETVTTGPLWATMLNAEADTIDAHDHTTGKGVQVPSAGINVNADLPFATNNATALRSARFTSQGVVFSLAADVGCVYVKGADLFYRDTGGTNIQITAGGVLNAAALNASNWPQQNVATDFAIVSSNANTHFSIDASVGNRVLTLPRAQDVAVGRFYIISDRLGSCTPVTPRTILIQREGTTTDTIDGAASITLDFPYGFAFIVATSATTWKIYRTRLASPTIFGAVLLAGDLGGVAQAPTVAGLTGDGTNIAVHSPVLRWDSGVLGPQISQSQAGAGAGKTLSIFAQSGGLAGTNAGGSMQLQPGAGTGGGADGAIVFANAAAAEIASVQPTYLRISSSALFKLSGTGTLGFEPRTSAGAGALMQITGQAGNGGGAGGAVTVTAGAGASATGGLLSLIGGAALTAGNGGGVVVQSGAQAGGGLNGSVSLNIAAYAALTCLEVVSGRRVIAIGGAPTTTDLPANTGDGILWVKRAATVPTALPVAGVSIYSDASDTAYFANGNGSLGFTCGTALSASTGASGATPAQVAGYIQIKVGTAIKNVPFYN